VRQDGRHFSDELAFRPLLCNYMLLPMSKANVGRTPFEAIPGTVSHNDTLGRYL